MKIMTPFSISPFHCMTWWCDEEFLHLFPFSFICVVLKRHVFMPSIEMTRSFTKNCILKKDFWFLIYPQRRSLRNHLVVRWRSNRKCPQIPRTWGSYTPGHFSTDLPVYTTFHSWQRRWLMVLTCILPMRRREKPLWYRQWLGWVPPDKKNTLKRDIKQACSISKDALQNFPFYVAAHSVALVLTPTPAHLADYDNLSCTK